MGRCSFQPRNASDDALRHRRLGPWDRPRVPLPCSVHNVIVGQAGRGSVSPVLECPGASLHLASPEPAHTWLVEHNLAGTARSQGHVLPCNLELPSLLLIERTRANLSGTRDLQAEHRNLAYLVMLRHGRSSCLLWNLRPKWTTSYIRAKAVSKPSSKVANIHSTRACPHSLLYSEGGEQCESGSLKQCHP